MASGLGDRVSAELDSYGRQLEWVLDQVAVSLGGLTASQLAWRPDTTETNSAWAIASHIVGCTRAYVLGFGCGWAVHRDRAAEFAAIGDHADELVGEVRALAREIASAMSSLNSSVLDETLLPPQELWGEGEPHEISRRDGIVQAIRHSAIHLGELRLTRELALRHD